jgi:parallel beta-helix repeat protein
VSGSDTNVGGDPASALRTISKAAEIALDGYTIVVGAGTYREGVTTDRSGRVAQRLRFIADVSGSQTGDAGQVLINATNTAVGAGFRVSGSLGTVVDGFTITGGADGGVVFKSRSNDSSVRNCVVFGNPGDGIRIQDSARVLLFNNLVFGNGGVGVGIVGPARAGSPDARIFQNTIFGNGARGITIGNSRTASPRSVLRNNIIQDNHGDATIKVFTPPPSTIPRSDVGYDEDFNLILPVRLIPANLELGVNSIFQDARFVDTAGGDFHLRQNSPAIDAGASLSADLEAVLRSRTATGGEVDTGPLDLGFHDDRL